MTTPRTLPLRVAPLPGEALDSWLEVLANRLTTPLNDLLPHLGLARPRFPQKPLDWMIALRADEAAGISAATGTDPETLHRMTLAHYDQRALLIDHAIRRVNGRQLWGRGRGSRYCPDCLSVNGGRWLLSWRLGWSFACLDHRRMLADLCPDCGRLQRLQPDPGGQLSRLGRCMNPSAAAAYGRSAARCGHQLSTTHTAQLPTGHPALATQRILMQVIEEDTAAFGVYADYPQNARTALADIKSVAARIISRATRQHLVQILPHDLLEIYEEGLAQSPGRDLHTPDLRREGSMSPTQATTVAAGLTAAIRILLKSDVRAAGEALRWLIQIPSPVTQAPALAPTVIISDWGRGISEVLRGVLFSALEPTMLSISRLRYRTGSPLPATPAPAGLSIERSARIPAMLWASWALRVLPQKGVYLQTLRTALPCLVLQVGSNLTHDRAMKLLGEVTDSTNSSRILQQLQDGPHWRDIQTALIRLAEFLDGNPPPIDYRRRRLLDYSQLLPEQEWDEFCRRSVASTGRGPRHRLTRCYLFERISGIPAELAPEPFAANTSSWRSQLRNFPETLTPGFTAELERASIEFLDRHGIREPIEWQPPIELLDGLTLPGFDPSRVEATVVHELMRRESLSLKQVATRLSTSTHVICHILEQEPAPQSRWQARTAGAVREDLKRRLPPSELARQYELYSESEIARKFGTSGALIRRIAREYGLPRRPPGSVRKCPPLAGEWLREQFNIQERRLAEPASGSSKDLSMRSGKHQLLRVPPQSRGDRSGEDTPGTKSLADGAPEVLNPALTGIYGWERLARFAAAVPYGSLSEAAKNLGICRSVISMQIRQLERSLGGPLYVRTQRNQPMQLTPLGIEVLDAIQNIGLGRTEL